MIWHGVNSSNLASCNDTQQFSQKKYKRSPLFKKVKQASTRGRKHSRTYPSLSNISQGVSQKEKNPQQDENSGQWSNEKNSRRISPSIAEVMKQKAHK